MSRKLVTLIRELTPANRAAITETAVSLGFEPVFLDQNTDAADDIREAEIVFGSNPAFLSESKNLKWVCTPSAGINQFTKPGVFPSPDVMLSNSSGAYGVTISEHIVMMILEILRRQPEYCCIVDRREWIRWLPIRSIHGARVTMLGTGDIGCRAAERIRAFGPAKIIGVNRRGSNPGDIFDLIVKQDELSAVLPETDILVMSLPGTANTNHIMDAKMLSLLPDRSVLINVGRGSTMDQSALEAELRSGRLFAGLDVFEIEPIPQDSSIWECPNLLITPHAAGNMSLPCTVDIIVDMFIEDLKNYAVGKPIKNLIDIPTGY